MARWAVIGDSETVLQQGHDATLWRWQLRETRGPLRTTILVKVSSTAMAVAPENLPEITRRARESSGESEVKKVLDWWQPPKVLELHTRSTEARPAGGAEVMPDDDSDPACENRLALMRGWLRTQNYWLDVERQGDQWIALVARRDNPVAAGIAATGRLRVEAAENLLSALGWPDQEQRDVTIEALPATARATAPPATVTITAAGGSESREAFDTSAAEVFGAVEAEREELLKIAADFGWRIAFAQEPDGSYFWIVLDAETGEAIKSGTAKAWDDARLAVIEDIYPPSGEE